MAKQQGVIRLSGSLHGNTYYHANGKYLVKRKSSLDKARFYTDPAFEGSRKIADQTKITAPLASFVYQQLPKEVRKHGLIGRMIGEAGRLLRAGFTEKEITDLLLSKFNASTAKVK